MKKLLSLLVSSVLVIELLPMSVFAVSSDFSDVTYSDPSREAINFLKENDVVEGYGDGTFKSLNKINRAEFLKIVVGSLDDFDVRKENGKDCFTDVKDEWFARYVCYAKSKGIVGGYSDGSFKPANNINFAEASKIVVNAFDFDESEISQRDPWYRAFVEPLAEQKAIPMSISDLDKSIARGEMAEVIFRIKDETNDEKSLKYYDLEGVPVAGQSCDVLKEYFETSRRSYEDVYYLEEEADMAAPRALSDSVDTGAAASSKTLSGGESITSGSDEYSTTNIQVQGVDEADFVKNDGKYIYIVNDGSIRIIEAYPTEDMHEVVRFDMSEKNMTPAEIYLSGDLLTVIGNKYTYDEVYPLEGESADALAREFWYPEFHEERTVVEIYNLDNIVEPKLKRKLEFDGYYSESRRVGDTMYLVLNKYGYGYGFYSPVKDTLEPEMLLPRYTDSMRRAELAPHDEEQFLADCEDITYFPRVRDLNYVIAIAIPLKSTKDIVAEVMLGSSENIYSSVENLYIASTNYDSGENFYHDWDNAKTMVYRYSLSPSSIEYKSRGKVPGTILNQFSMDEHENYFRIATTTGDLWGDGENVSKNNLYVLSANMDIVGSITDIAPGEKIYSTRFIGDRGYMVTFKKVDPLFALDLSDPKNPKILGKLKIPGYSDYIHPYDENHIIGFGKDAVEAEEELSSRRNLAEGFAWYQGMKIALFDVTDPTNPKQMFSEVIGDRGTHSELLYDHKALLFDREKNLLAFPVQVAEIDRSNCIDLNDCVLPANTYGETVFEGAYVYSLDLENGFKLRGKITHYSPEDEEFLKQGDYWYGDYMKQIHRILYIGSNLYTVADGGIKASDINTAKEKNFVELQPALKYDDEIYEEGVGGVLRKMFR